MREDKRKTGLPSGQIIISRSAKEQETIKIEFFKYMYIIVFSLNHHKSVHDRCTFNHIPAWTDGHRSVVLLSGVALL